MAYVIVAVVLVLVVFVVSEPLRRRRQAGEREAPGHVYEPAGGAGPPPELTELEAARDAKYREIRDAELDHQTGKLSDEDWRAIDSTLREQAIEILRELDRVAGNSG